MSVALISAVDPYPTDAGKKVVLAGFIDYFVDRHGRDNVHYIKVGAPPKREFPVRLHVVPGPSRAEVLRNVATKSAFGRASLQESFLGSRQASIAIRRIIDEIGPQLHVYDTVRMAQYAPPDVAANQICYIDDLFSERYDGMLAAAELHPDLNFSPLGNFNEHVPRRLHALATNRISQVALLRVERELVRRSEDQAARNFHRCLLLNADEAALLTQRTGSPLGRIHCVPPLIAIPATAERRQTATPTFVFLGDLSLAHNDDALRWFLQTVWPTVLARLPAARLLVLGRGAGPQLLAQAAELADSVSIDGYVPDLGDALGRAVAMLNPLRFGSGIKLKVIEALGRSLPVVSTPIGADGIASGPGTGILIGQEPAELADLLCSATDPAVNAELSSDARDHFQSTYSREGAFAAYDAAFAVPQATGR